MRARSSVQTGLVTGPKLLSRGARVTLRRLEVDRNASDDPVGGVEHHRLARFQPSVTVVDGLAQLDSHDPAVDMMLMMLPYLARVQGNRHFISEIMDRFMKQKNRTRFELMNAVTSVARDTKDPVAKWKLEELGGAIACETPRPAFEAIERRLQQRLNVSRA